MGLSEADWFLPSLQQDHPNHCDHMVIREGLNFVEFPMNQINNSLWIQMINLIIASFFDSPPNINSWPIGQKPLESSLLQPPYL